MIKEFEKKIGYTFKNPALLEEALTTPACKMTDRNIADNQRLEFLGDAVFGLLSAEYVFDAHPEKQEGELTVLRTNLVSGATLAQAGEKLGLRKFIRRNKGASPLPENSKVLADALEAVMGALWLDGGISIAKVFFNKLELPFTSTIKESETNPKGYLQVFAQARKKKPVYAVISSVGPDHAPTVTVSVEIKGIGIDTATALTQRKAEAAAASELIKQLAEKGMV